MTAAGSSSGGAAGPMSAATAAASEENLTSPGAALGTVAYMSPEQVRAKELDARTDLFSFGAVLYEMATGAMPFRGESSGVIFNAILERDPVPPVRMNPDLPPKLEDIINKALEKDRNLRYQGAAEMRADLLRLKRDTESGKAPAPSLATATAAPEKQARPVQRFWSRWAVIYATAVIIAGMLVAWLKWPLPRARVLRTTQVTTDGTVKVPALFTDGSRLYYAAYGQAGLVPYQISIAGGEAAPFSESSLGSYGYLAGISPNGSELLAQSWEGSTGQGPLWIVPTLTGPRHRLGNIVSSDAGWAPDGNRCSPHFDNGRSTFLDSMGTRWKEIAAYRDGQDWCAIALGGDGGWVRPSPTASWLERFSFRMLWQLDPGRKIFHLSVQP